MKRLFIFSILSSLMFSSCFFWGDRVKGNGHIISDDRTHSGFTNVHVSSAIHVYLTQDSVYSVKVETDENLQPYVIVSQSNNTLHIRQQSHTRLDPTGHIKVYVSAPAFRYLDASGACKIVGQNRLNSAEEISLELSGASGATLDLKAPKVSAKMSGASHASLMGETKDLLIRGSGASHARCFELLSESADVDVSGASNADVFASVRLRGEASGASDIRYKGNASVDQHVSGAGSVKKAN